MRDPPGQSLTKRKLILMKSAFAAVLDEYRSRMAHEAQLMRTLPPGEFLARRDEMLLPVGEHEAEMLRSMIVAQGATRIVELGTSYGFSTLFLADAARQTGGRVETFELSAHKQAAARDALTRANLAQYVDFRLGDAVELIETLQPGVQFAFIDLWKDLYVPCFHALRPKLAPGAILVADNILFPEPVRPMANLYRAAVRETPGFTSVLLPIGQGLEVSSWKAD
jgi:predicted O-methyltransferase YrrM